MTRAATAISALCLVVVLLVGGAVAAKRLSVHAARKRVLAARVDVHGGITKMVPAQRLPAMLVMIQAHEREIRAMRLKIQALEANQKRMSVAPRERISGGIDATD